MAGDAPPVVSIIVPAYNAAAFLASALGSAVAQTLRALEVIVVDDGSSDRTAAIADEFASRDSRVRLVRHASSRGAAAARNTAIAHASGRWVAPLDADDVLLPTRTEILLERAETAGADLVADNLMFATFPEHRFIKPAIADSDRLSAEPVTLSVFLGRELTRGAFSLGFLKPIIRREFLARHQLRYDEEVRIVHDFLLYVECLLRGGVFLLHPDPLYVYALRRESLSNGKALTSLLEIDRVNRRIQTVPDIQANREWRDLVAKRQRAIDKTMTAVRFVDTLRNGGTGAALRLLKNNPAEIPACLGRVVDGVGRRLFGRWQQPHGFG
jgi:succinoglycan biosynthesis protein ExoO/succinoglycan biosynthesis protein ExoU